MSKVRCLSRIARLTVLVLAAVVLKPAVSYAQSAIAGVVTDSTGAVLPGVSVEASSPALIEQVRSALTDGQGQYRIINLRPGVYTVTFTLSGFNVVVREDIRLEADFTAPINVQLRVGTVEETVTVSGQSPVVDVQSTQRREVLQSSFVDTLPTGRSYQTVAALLPAVNIGQLDLGGSSQMWQGQVTAYGGSGNDFKINIDGMDSSITLSTGLHSGLYLNDGGFEEYVYQINAGNADTQTGGVRLNIIPKQGGNKFSGQYLTTYSDENTQGNNLTDALRAQGVKTPPGLYRQYDVNASLGGPIIRDRLWFFTSYRIWAFNYYIINVLNADGTPFHDTNLLKAYPLRLTTQLSRKNKLTAVMERDPKDRKWRDIDNGLTDPKAAIGQPATLGYYAQVKWTSTLSNKTLVEAGYSTNFYNFLTPYQPEVKHPSATDPWGDISKQEIVSPAGRRWNAAAADSDNPFASFYADTTLSYLAGPHSFKVGFQDRWGYNRAQRDSNGGMTQRYRNGLPDSVTLGNYPIRSQSNVVDIGVFGQDAWRINNLTVNLGLRWDYFRGYLPAQDAPAGWWVPVRHFDRIDNLPLFKNVSPRLGASYDLFGNGKTALKGSIGRYVEQDATAFQERYNPMVTSTAIVSWTDLNRNDIAEGNRGCVYLSPGCEMNFAQLPSTFGVRRNRNPDPNIERAYQNLYNLTIQHELRPGLGLSVAYNRREFHNSAWTDNLATAAADYTLITIPDPRGTGTLPVYSLAANKLSLVDEFDANSKANRTTYNGFDVSLNARFSNGVTVFGGTSTGRSTGVNCEVESPNSLRFCDTTSGIPMRTTFKMSGSYPMPYGFKLGAVFQHLLGGTQTLTYSVGSAIAPGLTVSSVTVTLLPPGSQYYDGVNQLDLTVGRTFRTSNARITPKIEAFNLMNVNTVTSRVTAFGASLGLPTGIVPSRIVRFGVTVDF